MALGEDDCESSFERVPLTTQYFALWYDYCYGYGDDCTEFVYVGCTWSTYRDSLGIAMYSFCDKSTEAPRVARAPDSGRGRSAGNAVVC